MKSGVRALLVGATTVALSVALAAAAPSRVVGGTHELALFAVWSIPLAVLIGVFATRPRFTRLPIWGQAVAAAAFGALAGVALTLLGGILLGGWMLAWDFPVLYCWALAGSIGTVLATWSAGAIRLQHALAGTGAALLPLAVLAWIGSRPTPAVLIVYRDHPSRDAAQLVLDSVLSAPHSSGEGRAIRWPHSSYSRVATADGYTAALIGLYKAEHRDSIRLALVGHPLVLAVTDTVLPR